MALEERTEWGTAKQSITADEDFSIPEGKQLVKLNLACGNNRREGYVGVDLHKTDAVDVQQDLLKFPWAFEDNSIYEIFCSHFVEHIPIQLPDGQYGMNAFMEECYRILMPGGTMHIVAPYYTSVRAWQDPTHCRAITELTFQYYSQKFAKAIGVDHYIAKCNFEPISKTYALNPEWEAKSEEAREWARKHYYNVVADISFVIRKAELEK